MGRRDFMVSACGAASTLLAFNTANAAAGKIAGYFDVPDDAAFDSELASTVVGGNEFIFDVQSHYVDPAGGWSTELPRFAREFFSHIRGDSCDLTSPASYLNCLGPEQYIKDVFFDSDTDMIVLSFGPFGADGEPVTIEAADKMRRIVDSLEGTKRLLLHGRVKPTIPGDIEAMDELAEKWKISAWKTYTQYPEGGGYFLTDDAGLALIENAKRLGVRVICIHKGLPFDAGGDEYSTCVDIGKAAKAFPDVDFIVYHSGYVAGNPELPFDYGANRPGVDSLIRSLIDEDVGPHSNVYAELGSTWRFLMREPDSAAHALGKLFRYVGEDNILWGTDSIWYGSPQDQIQAFRSFQIAPDVRRRYGYPELTRERKAKVFGLNAARPYRVQAEEIRRHLAVDRIGKVKGSYAEVGSPDYRTYGPKSRREFLRFRNHHIG
jgi:predicted TIM-barrel fold metal-dependent hydrolase